MGTETVILRKMVHFLSKSQFLDADLLCKENSLLKKKEINFSMI